MYSLAALPFFLFGLFIGSFLNVVIYRIPRNESIVFPPSHCPHCRHALAFYDLAPLLSYLLLKGKCRYCRQKISLQYPMVELLTGLIFAALYFILPEFSLLYYFYLLFMSSIFLIVFFTDLKYGIIPFPVIISGYIAVLTYLIYSFSLHLLLVHILSALGAFLLFYVLYIITKRRGMGFGDVVLVSLIGIFLGFPGTIFALYSAFLTGAVASLILIIIGQKHLKHDTIPFGPFLTAGTFISIFFSSALIRLAQMYLPI